MQYYLFAPFLTQLPHYLPTPDPPVHGGYTDWDEWTECSTTCGEGQQTRSRSCTNPTPAYGGDDCSTLGDDKETKTCKLNVCPGK